MGYQTHFAFDVQEFDFMEKSAMLKQILRKQPQKSPILVLPPIEKRGAGCLSSFRG